jgi:riboflavin-specific deaminase-like protein
VGHLGQSLDGCIATRTGDSCYVSGRKNIRHLHRMRALSDAIIVGAETIAADDPWLTTRLVTGENPVRVVLDPRRRLHSEYELFKDGAAPTLLICAQEHMHGNLERHAQAEVVGVASSGGRLDLATALRRLWERGLLVSFVEGGGVTVSAFAQSRLLDRLQITVAPPGDRQRTPGTAASANDQHRRLRPAAPSDLPHGRGHPIRLRGRLQARAGTGLVDPDGRRSVDLIEDLLFFTRWTPSALS